MLHQCASTEHLAEAFDHELDRELNEWAEKWGWIGQQMVNRETRLHARFDPVERDVAVLKSDVAHLNIDGVWSLPPHPVR